jgi:hypothetical protein
MPRDHSEGRCDCRIGVPGHDHGLVSWNREREEPISYDTLVRIPCAEPPQVAGKFGVEPPPG